MATPGAALMLDSGVWFQEASVASHNAPDDRAVVPRSRRLDILVARARRAKKRFRFGGCAVRCRVMIMESLAWQLGNRLTQPLCRFVIDDWVSGTSSSISNFARRRAAYKCHQHVGLSPMYPPSDRHQSFRTEYRIRRSSSAGYISTHLESVFVSFGYFIKPQTSQLPLAGHMLE